MTTIQTQSRTIDTEARIACRRLVDELCERLLHAEALLHSLHRAKSESEARLAEERRADALKSVTGRSSLDGAIDSTRRLIDRLRCAINDAQVSLTAGEPIKCDLAARLRSAALAG